MSKEIRPYTVITHEGYWGKGMTPAEAARNANVGRTRVQGSLYYAHPKFVKGEVECGGMGGAEWEYRDEFYKSVIEPHPEVRQLVKKIVTVGQGALRIKGGKLEVQGCLTL